MCPKYFTSLHGTGPTTPHALERRMALVDTRLDEDEVDYEDDDAQSDSAVPLMGRPSEPAASSEAALARPRGVAICLQLAWCRTSRNVVGAVRPAAAICGRAPASPTTDPPAALLHSPTTDPPAALLHWKAMPCVQRVEALVTSRFSCRQHLAACHENLDLAYAFAVLALSDAVRVQSRPTIKKPSC